MDDDIESRMRRDVGALDGLSRRMKSGTERRRNQRLRAGSGVQGIERTSGTPVKVRDFSTKALAIESGVRILANRPVELELKHADETFVVHGVPVRSDRVLGSSGSGVWLTAVEVRWGTPQERSQFESFLWSVPRAFKQG